MAPRSTRTLLESALLAPELPSAPAGPPPALPASSPPRGAVLVVPARRHLPHRVWRTVTACVVAVAVTLILVIAVRAVAAVI